MHIYIHGDPIHSYKKRFRYTHTHTLALPPPFSNVFIIHTYIHTCKILLHPASSHSCLCFWVSSDTCGTEYVEEADRTISESDAMCVAMQQVQ